MLAELRIHLAARAAARTAAANPDPNEAVQTARRKLGRHADRYRISVSRPGVVGRSATVPHQPHPPPTPHRPRIRTRHQMNVIR